MPANSRSACGRHRPSNATSWGAAGWRNAAGRRSRGRRASGSPAACRAATGPAAAAGRQLSPQRAGRMLVRRQRSDVGDLCRSAGAALRFRACDADLAQAQKARFSECAMNGAHWGAPADAGGVQGVRSGAGQHGAGRDAGSEPDGTAVDRRPATERPPAWGEASSRRNVPLTADPFLSAIDARYAHQQPGPRQSSYQRPTGVSRYV